MSLQVELYGSKIEARRWFMRVRLRMREQMTREAEKDWLLNEVNKDLTPGRGVLKFTFWLVALIVLVAILIVSSTRLPAM